ncbi:DUF1553 domain-containing protein [Novipirellula sp. SH528]|uniref:DUF1553 domain-containing protein n=1 Tax=Novipirellula sp. SH528 TaxID=3454466 RepID=UPI003F9EE7E3
MNLKTPLLVSALLAFLTYGFSTSGFADAAESPTLVSTSKTPAMPDQVRFNAHIRPIMSNTCFACHGPDAEENPSGYRIDSFAAATAVLPSDDEAVGIKPGDPMHSEAYLRIIDEGDGEQMPPEEFRHRLTEYDKALFRKWIEQGAEYEEHWSYAPITRPSIPAVQAFANRVHNPIDAFVLARLETEGITPSEIADKRTLLRRLSLDLIGLPPTPDELQSFLDDNSEGAYERQVERLLASEHFGERMASFWLDLVHFADTVGFHGDQNQRIAPYRDYVIRSFNTNKPYDAFTREQLAGDLLPDPTPEQLAATGLLRLNMVTREGGAQPEEYLAKSKADRVRMMGTAFLGSTLACCECHNHKFDPFSAHDFYSIGAFFDDIRQWGVYADYGYTPNPELRGFNNDYPFPPEIRIDSESARNEIRFLQAERDRELFAKLGDSVLSKPEFDQWVKSTGNLLQKNPGGWIVADIVDVVASGNTKPTLKNDGSILLTGKVKKAETIKIDTKIDDAVLVNSIRLEVLPDEAHGNRVGRSDEGRFTVGVSVDLQRGTSEPQKTIAVKPRFIRIELPGKNKILSLAEVQVFAKDADGKLQNIAVKGKARHSADYKSGDASLAIDGNTDGHYYNAESVTHTNPGNDPWWELDLGSAQTIEKFAIWNRTDSAEYAKRLTHYHVKLLDENRSELLAFSPPTPGPSVEIDVPSEVVTDTSEAIKIAWGEADRKNPKRYTSGAEPLVLEDVWRSGPAVWQLPSDETSYPHTAVYHFDHPVWVTPQDRLRTTLHSNDVGRVRISMTPIAHAVAGWDAATPELNDAIKTEANQRSQQQNALLASTFHRSIVPYSQQLSESHSFRDRILEQHSGMAMSLVVQSVPEDRIPESRILPRGNWQDKTGELAPPATPHFLPELEIDSARRLTRLDLANWLTSPSNPLTSRHVVNRTWKQFFGTGLSGKLDDLGSQGEWPSHPLLLDWMAAEFIESGWDVKQMVRLIVNSHTYQQTAAQREDLSDTDPYNRLLASQSPRRLEAEVIRDNALAIAGLLVTDFVGGSSVYPYQPDGHYSNLQFPNRTYHASSDSRQYRRGVYMHWQRTFLHPMLVNFDAPSRDECTADRPLSNSPQQALTLLNDPSFAEASHAMADRLLADHEDGTFNNWLEEAFLIALSRQPSDGERMALRTLYDRQLTYYQTNPAEAEKYIAVGRKTAPKSSADVSQIAALGQVCRVILNLHETITRF